jgi:hypothetical protein
MRRRHPQATYGLSLLRRVASSWAFPDRLEILLVRTANLCAEAATTGTVNVGWATVLTPEELHAIPAR